MRQCTKCFVVKEDFSPQKTNPSKLYSWCDSCRLDPMNRVTSLTTNQKKVLKEEYRSLRSKAVELRRFSPEECTALKSRVAGGATMKALAREYQVSPATISKAVRNYT